MCLQTRILSHCLSLLSFKNKEFDVGLLHPKAKAFHNYVFIFLMSKYPHQSHDLRVFTLHFRPPVSLCSQRGDPLRINTKTGKTVCVTNHTPVTLYAYDGWEDLARV